MMHCPRFIFAFQWKENNMWKYRQKIRHFLPPIFWKVNKSQGIFRNSDHGNRIGNFDFYNTCIKRRKMTEKTLQEPESSGELWGYINSLLFFLYWNPQRGAIFSLVSKFLRMQNQYFGCFSGPFDISQAIFNCKFKRQQSRNQHFLT